jgi:hypothetical protein
MASQSPFSLIPKLAAFWIALLILPLIERTLLGARTYRNQVLLSSFTDFENFSVFKPAPQHEKSVNELFDQVIAWSSALQALQ